MKARSKDAPASLEPAWEGDVRKLVSAATLESIDLVKVEAQRFHDGLFDARQLPTAVEYDIEASVELEVAETFQVSGTSVLVGIAVAWKDSNGKQYVTARVTFRAAYSFQGLNVSPPEPLVKIFAQDLALHHVWPFLRERLRTFSVELGMPPLLLPLRKVTP
jgi:preprotein translocase subunit SecB